MLRAELSELKQQIHTIVPDILRKREILEKDSRQTHEIYCKSDMVGRPKLRDFVEINKSTPRYGNCDSSLLDMNTTAKCDAVVQHQNKVVVDLQIQLKQLNQLGSQILKQHELAQKELNSKMQELQRMEQEANNDTVRNMSSERQAEQTKREVDEWNQISGVTIQRENRDQLLIRMTHFKLSDSDSPCLRVQINGAHIISAEWVRPVPVDIRDIVSFACETKDLQFLIRETQNRLFASGALKRDRPVAPLSKEELGTIRRNSLGLTPRK